MTRGEWRNPRNVLRKPDDVYARVAAASRRYTRVPNDPGCNRHFSPATVRRRLDGMFDVRLRNSVTSAVSGSAFTRAYEKTPTRTKRRVYVLLKTNFVPFARAFNKLRGFRTRDNNGPSIGRIQSFRDIARGRIVFRKSARTSTHVRAQRRNVYLECT